MDQLISLRKNGQYTAANKLEDEIIINLREDLIIEDSGEMDKGASHPHKLLLKSGLAGIFKEPIAFKFNNIGDWFSSFIYAEEAAYIISRDIGFNIVPPTVIRKYNNKIGSFQLFVENAVTPDINYEK